MMEPRELQTPAMESSASGLDRGDASALAARWREAVSAWEGMLPTADGDRARARLSWLADQGTVSGNSTSDRWWSGPIAVGFGAVVVATGLVLVAEHQSQTISNLLATVAWLLYVVGAGCGLLYAYRHRPRQLATTDTTLVERARAVAIAVENGSGTIGAGSGPVS